MNTVSNRPPYLPPIPENKEVCRRLRQVDFNKLNGVSTIPKSKTNFDLYKHMGSLDFD